MNRREFVSLASGAGAFALGGCRFFLFDDPFAFPTTGNVAPNYWTTWETQCYSRATAIRTGKMPAQIDGKPLRNSDNLNEKAIFGAPGAWKDFYPRSRRDLFMVLDDGLDVPYGASIASHGIGLYGSLELNETRFPSLAGLKPVERLRTLDRRLKDAGWRGLGLWVACGATGDANGQPVSDAETEAQLRRKLGWCAEAGVRYWKVDWGSRTHDLEFRALVSRLADEICPDIFIEHGMNGGPTNDLSFDASGRAAGSCTLRKASGPEADLMRRRAESYLSHADLFRIYDLVNPLTVATALERTAYYLETADRIGSKTILNLEDELYMAAALGCTFGVMRSPGCTDEPERYRNPVGDKLQEVDRATAWHRIAPPFPSVGVPCAVADDDLSDDWSFQTEAQTWWTEGIGRQAVQRAPSAVSRGLPLPEVKGADKPFVACSRNPNGAVAVAALDRLSERRGLYHPLADVVLAVAPAPGLPLGVFGRMKSLTVPAAHGVRVLARDILGGAVSDITSACAFADGCVTLPGDVLAQIGIRAGTDKSDPGTLVAFT